MVTPPRSKVLTIAMMVTAQCFTKGRSYKCLGSEKFICHKRRRWSTPPDIKFTDLVITNDAEYGIVCKSAACPPNWAFRNETGYRYMPSERLQINATSARLLFQNATGNDAGTYACITAGNETSFTPVTVRVQEKPVIIGASKISDCSVNVSVTWIPNEYAVNYTHRFTINDSMAFEVTPRRRGEHTTVISNLLDFGIYKIGITACQSSCSGTFTPATTYTTTGGLISELVTIRDIQTRKTCVIIWDESSSILEKYTQFKVTIREETVDYRADSPVLNNWEATISAPTYRFPVKPNRRYSSTISTVQCANVGNPTFANLDCKSSPSAPVEILPPRIRVSDVITEPTVSVFIPSEHDGLMSCLLVVLKNVKPNTGSTSLDQGITEYDISGFREELNISGFHVLKAMPPRSFSEMGQKHHFVIGDDTISSCDTSNQSTDVRVNQNCGGAVICGRNTALEKESQYKIALIAVVPITNETKLSVHRSADSEINAGAPTDVNTGLDASTIAAIALGVLAFLSILFSVILFIKKRKAKPDHTNARVDARMQSEFPEGAYDIADLSTDIAQPSSSSADKAKIGKEEDGNVYAIMTSTEKTREETAT